MPHNPLAAIVQPFISKTGNKRVGFGFQGFRKHAARALLRKLCQRISNRFRLAKRQDGCIVLHRRIAPCEVLAGFDTRHNTPPFKSRHHPNSGIALQPFVKAACKKLSGPQVAVKHLD
jgi:hypothetical protein